MANMDEKQIGSQTAREGGSSGNVQDWNMMECRMAYLQAQMEEAQAALARKTTQQEAIEKRAEEAEAAQAKAEAEVAETKLECESLKETLDEREKALQLAQFFIAERARTESALSSQAREVLGCLSLTEAEAAALHEHLSEAASTVAAQTARRAAFSEASHETLQTMQAQLTSLGTQLSAQRAAALSSAN